MDIYQVIGSIILISFYAIYIGKMLSQKKKGVQTDQIGKGNKPQKVIMIELIMKFATYSIVLVEVLSIVFNANILSEQFRVIGSCLGIIGNIIFFTAIYTMRDSWRAGIPENDKTAIVTKGIYGFSRNPAFVGFDLVYLGNLLLFFNIFNLVFTIFAVIMLHLQIIQEEKFLSEMFGDEYLEYKNRVYRYWGRK